MREETAQFSSRQVMNRPDFEFFHNTNTRPVDVAYHSHDFYELYYFLSGNVSYVVEGKTYRLQRGDLLLTNNRELHKPLVEDGCPYDRFVVWIRPAYLRSLSRGGEDLASCFEASARRHHNLLRPGGALGQEIYERLQRMEEASRRTFYGREALLQAYLTELLVLVNGAYLQVKGDEGYDIVYHEKVSEVLRYINENLCADLSLDALSARFYVSKFHLGRQFKQYVGLTLHQYIRKKRLIAAKLLLLDGASVREAFEASGFGDLSNFLKGFQREFGKTPKQFRREKGPALRAAKQ